MLRYFSPAPGPAPAAGRRPHGHRVDERPVIPLVLIGVPLGERLQRPVEGVTVAEVGRDGDAVAGPRVRPGQRRPAQLPEGTHAARHHQFGFHHALPIAQLAYVEVPALPVEPLDPLPAQEDVSRGLHQALARHHPLALVPVRTRPRVRGEYRGVRLLGLEEERIPAVPAQQEEDPAAGPDAAHTDDLAGHVHGLEVGEQGPPV